MESVTSSEPEWADSFELRLNGTYLGRFAWASAIFEVLLIAVGPWPVRIFALGILALSLFVLLVPRAKRQEVRLLDDRIEVQLGLGKAFRIPYQDIAIVEERQAKFGPFGRFIIWLGSLRTGVKPLGWPYVWVTFNRRIFRVSWIPFPVPAFAKNQMLPAWETTKLIEELQWRIPPQTGWTIPTSQTASGPPA